MQRETRRKTEGKKEEESGRRKGKEGEEMADGVYGRKA